MDTTRCTHCDRRLDLDRLVMGYRRCSDHPDHTPAACGHVDCSLVKHPRTTTGSTNLIRDCRIDAAGDVR